MSVQALIWFLVEQDGAVLLGRRKPEAAPFAGQWTLPGDAAHPGESSSYAIARFARDQLDIDVLGDELVDTLQLSEAGVDYAASVYRVGFEGHPRYRESGPFSEAGWAHDGDLPQPMPAPLAAFLAGGAT